MKKKIQREKKRHTNVRGRVGNNEQRKERGTTNLLIFFSNFNLFHLFIGFAGRRRRRRTPRSNSGRCLLFNNLLQRRKDGREREREREEKKKETRRDHEKGG
jgi:hypothetical protein